MFLKSNDTFKLLEKENKRLKKENMQLYKQVEEVAKYKDDYKNLIRTVKEQKDRYNALNEKLEKLIEQCKNDLKKI